MKEMTLQDIQKVSLDILKDVHNFCVSNNIKYSLAYGTLIGAVRHNGFIPWDDDIDIVMTRPYYDEFCKKYTSHFFKLIPSEQSFLPFARVCDTLSTTYTSTTPWTGQKGLGVCIDIFPIDAVSDIREEFSVLIQELSVLHDNLIHGRKAKASLSFNYTFKQNIRILWDKIRYVNINVKRLKDEICKIATSRQFGTTGHCSQLVCRGNKDKEFFTNDMFDTYKLMMFEECGFMVCKGWHDMLTMNFGNYMNLPPESKRKPHATYIKYYWK